MRISGAAIHQRIRKLDDSGVILRGPRLIVDPKMMGFDVCAHISITLRDPQLLKQTVEELRKIPEIVEAHFITGNGKHPRQTLLRGQRTPYVRSSTASCVSRASPSTETQISLQEAFQLPGEHRLHRGVVRTTPFFGKGGRPENPGFRLCVRTCRGTGRRPRPRTHKESTLPIRRGAPWQTIV